MFIIPPCIYFNFMILSPIFISHVVNEIVLNTKQAFYFLRGKTGKFTIIDTSADYPLYTTGDSGSQSKGSESFLGESNAQEFQSILLDLGHLHFVEEVELILAPTNATASILFTGYNPEITVNTQECIQIHKGNIMSNFGCGYLARFTIVKVGQEPAQLKHIKLIGYETYMELYAGCYMPTLDNSTEVNTVSSLLNGIEKCAQGHHEYVGIMFNGKYICLNNFGTLFPRDANECRSSCLGQAGQFCGGHAFALYMTDMFKLGREVRLSEKCAFQGQSCPICDNGLQGVSCIYRNCNIRNGGCKYRCILMQNTDSPLQNALNTVKHGVCHCLEGFRLNNKEECEDIDECEQNLCSANISNCSNTVGSYQCLCPEGFIYKSAACHDINECNSKSLCGRYGSCYNTIGSFDCSCRYGFNKVGLNCEDIDECSTAKHKCSNMYICSNTEGSYKCICPSGMEPVFINSSQLCPDENQCESSNMCDVATTLCVDLLVGYTCKCLAGYEPLHIHACKKIVDPDPDDSLDLDNHRANVTVKAKGHARRKATPPSVSLYHLTVCSALLVAIISATVFVVNRHLKKRKRRNRNRRHSNHQERSRDPDQSIDNE